MIDAELEASQKQPARRVILVDGFNVLHAVLLGPERERWWRREVRERLLARIGLWQGEQSRMGEGGAGDEHGGTDEIWVAFDGAKPAWSVWAEPVAEPMKRRGAGATVHSVFVESADDWIVRRARRAPDPTRTIVVSADRKVTGRARSAGCETWTPWAFMSRCPSEADAKGSEPPTGESAARAGGRTDDSPRANI
ncbi:MAG: hypothetical protein CL908_04235 [Deltaproteobacteria bacterium]|nr:hypothetical protein [Deltaproteobacteria bacterium]